LKKISKIEGNKLKTLSNKKEVYNCIDLVENLIGGFVHHEDPIFSFFIGIEVFVFY